MAQVRILSRRSALGWLGLGAATAVLATACSGAPPTQAAAKPEEAAKPAPPTAAPDAARPSASTAAPEAKATSAPGGPSAASSPTAATGAISAAPAKPAAGAVSVSYWHIWGGVRVQQLQGILDKFQTANPAIKVEPLLIPNPGYQDKLIPALAGSPPDAMMAYTDVFAPAAKRGALRRTDDMIKRDKIDPKDYYDGVWAQSVWNGVPYGLPYIGNFLQMLYWNKDMLKEGGFDPEKGPTTWADLIAMAKKLAVVKDGKLERMGFQTSSNDFRNGVYNNGAAILDPESGRSSVNNPQAVAAMQYALDLVEAQGGNDLVSAARSAFKDAQLNDPLLAKKGAIEQSGVFTVNLIKQQAPGLSWKLGKLPHGPNGESRDLVLGSWTNVLPTKGKNVDQAWELIKYLSHGEGHQEFMKIQARPAMVRKYNQAPYDADQRKENPYWDTVLDILNSTVSYPSSDKLGEVDKLVNEAYDNVVAKKMKPDEAVGWLDTQIQKVVNQG